MVTDEQIGKNVQRIRGEMSQATLAELMREQGFKWSQATVWAVEKGERPLRMTEGEALVGVMGVNFFNLRGTDRETDIQILMRAASSAYQEIKRQAQLYMNARVSIEASIEMAKDAGEELGLVHAQGGGWLDIGPVEAAREGLYEWLHGDATAEAASEYARRRQEQDNSLEEPDLLRDAVIVSGGEEQRETPLRPMGGRGDG